MRTAGKVLTRPGDARRTARVLTATVVAQVTIVVTGGLVRITGSGLGCPSWPACTPQSLGPTHSGPAMWIEFSNRLVAAGVIVLCVASLIAVARRGDRFLTRWAAGQLTGVVAQAVIGGLAVIADLAPVLVALHMFVSAFLIYAAVTIRLQYAGPGPAPRVERRVQRLTTATCALGLVVVIAGTVVSASGPYAGDAASARLAVDWMLVTRLHALAATGLLASLVATVWAARRQTANRQTASPPATTGALLTGIFGLLVMQLGVGEWQVRSGRPAIGVAVHLLLAATLLAGLSCLHRLVHLARAGVPVHSQEGTEIP
ncbi:COX15/CtaA family protein [Kribbella sp. NPDC026611]|uniref:COX15/CtaA family protein n=1 Tax=Kribbella sp. NPDC026611 TaxID=3154911 RepID=UPI0033D51B25